MFLIPSILETINKHNSVVIDGNFYHKTVLEHLLSKLNQKDIFVFTLKANKDTCIKRDAEREKSYGVVAATAVYDLVSRFDYGTVILNEGEDIEEKITAIKDKLDF